MTKPTTNSVSFSPDQLRLVIAQAIAEHEAAKAEKAKSDNSSEYEKLAVRAFKKAGFGDNVPREDRRTYNGWLTEGFKVKPGEHAVRVKSLRLFHRSQCVALNAVEKKAALAKLEEKKAKTSDRLPAVNLIEPAKPAPKARGKGTIIPLQPNA